MTPASRGASVKGRGDLKGNCRLVKQTRNGIFETNTLHGFRDKRRDGQLLMLCATRTASVAMMLSVVTSFSSGEAVTRATAPPDNTP